MKSSTKVRKFLECTNRNNHQLNEDAIQLVQNRYVNKMKLKGWRLDESVQSTSGDSFFEYEKFITLIKI